MEPTIQPKGGRIKRGWQMTKSAWQVLVLDKELLTIPIFSFIVSLVALLPFVLLAIVTSSDKSAIVAGNSGDTSSINPVTILIGFTALFVMTTIANFFAGAIIHAALVRFRGGDPTVGNSLAGAWKKFGPIAGFSLLATTVGYILSLIQERVPFAGKIAVWIANAAWNIATLFAIPIIIDRQETVGPLQAVRESANIVKKTWGENIVVTLGIGLIGFLSFLVASILGMAAIVASATLGAPSVVMIALAVLLVLGLIVLALVFTLLDAIARVAIYYYATTGKAPEVFNQELLKAAMTVKKARKIFA